MYGADRDFDFSEGSIAKAYADRVARYPDVDPEAVRLYDQIRNSSDSDIYAIAKNYGFRAEDVAEMKSNLFINEHLVPVGPGPANLVKKRFDPEWYYAKLWLGAADGSLDRFDQAAFDALLWHENVEAQLMRAGMPFQSSHPAAWVKSSVGGWDYRPTPEHFGAHDLAPLGSHRRGSHRRDGDYFTHYSGLGRR